MVCVNYYGVIQSSVIALKTLCALPVHPSLLPLFLATGDLLLLP